MDPQSERWIIAFAGLGIVGGLLLLLRGMGSYRAQMRVADIATSSIDSIAAGEVRVSGIVEPAELTLVSLLQSRQCSTPAAGDRLGAARWTGPWRPPSSSASMPRGSGQPWPASATATAAGRIVKRVSSRATR